MKNRYLFGAASMLLCATMACKELGFPGSQDGDHEYEVVITPTPPDVKPLPVVWKEEYDAGNVVPGDHTQHMLDFTYCESAPDRIYMAQDVAGVWGSTDFGQNWFTLSNVGLHTPFIISVEVDPLDKNRVLAAAQCRYYDDVNQSYQGIYLSTDGGITWQKKASRQDLGEVRSSTKLLAYAPTSKNTATGYATRWYAAFGENKKTGGNTSGPVADDGLMYSDDGGQSWSEVRKLPGSEYGDLIRGVKVHTTKEEKVFVYGNGGLFRFEDATDPVGIVTKLSGRGGLPEGDIWGRLYQSTDGKTLIVGISQQGIYKSTNAGANWSLLYGWDAINYCYVNEGHPNKIFAVPRAQSGAQIRISDDGGATWSTPQSVTYRLGYNNSNWNTGINGQFTCILPDPRDENVVFAHTNSKHFRSDDGGANWYHSDNGYNGAQHAGIGQEQMFDPTNSDRFGYFMVDRGVNFSDSRGRWFYPNTVDQDALGLNWSTALAGALHPVASTQVILASVGKSPNGSLIRSADNGQTWTKVTTSGNKPRWILAFDLQNPDSCYQWRERSGDAGLTWTEMTNMPANAILCGVSRSNGSILYAMNINGTKDKIFRSDDRGDTWTQVIQTTWDLTFPGPNQMFVFRVHPQNPDIIYTSSATGGVSMWDLSVSGTPTPTDFSFPGGGESNFFINRLAIDARYPQVMYAANQRANTGNKLYRSIDSGATWENISDVIPQSDLGGLAVSPVTGEVYVSGQNGSMVMLPPYSTSGTAYQIVPYSSNHKSQPYN